MGRRPAERFAVGVWWEPTGGWPNAREEGGRAIVVLGFLSWGGDHPSGLDWEYETKPKLAKWAGTTTYQQDPRTRLISASVEVQGKNRYGTVIGGSIIIEGALCGIVQGDKNLKQTMPLPIHGVMTLDVSGFNSLHLNYDTPASAQESSGTIVYCLFIGCFSEVFDDPDEPHIQRCGLMLRPTSVEGRFERVGRWKQYVEDWTKRQEVWTKEASVFQVEII